MADPDLDLEAHVEAWGASSAKKRAPPDQSEHRLQIAIIKWARAQVVEPHDLLAFDRSKAHSARQHMHEAARGVRAGTPDLLLTFAHMSGRCAFWIEAKSRDGALRQAQRDFGARMAVLGHRWFVVRSVGDLLRELQAAGVKLAGTAIWAARDADARLEAALMRRAAAAPVKKRPARKPRERAVTSQRALHIYTRLGKTLRDG